MKLQQMLEAQRTEPLGGVPFDVVIAQAMHFLVLSLTDPLLAAARVATPHATCERVNELLRTSTGTVQVKAQKLWVMFFFGMDWDDVEHVALLHGLSMSDAWSESKLAPKTETFSQN